ncbi:hypothetical protein VTI74DRAFT_646 [Chaetomium olivicolor]
MQQASRPKTGRATCSDEDRCARATGVDQRYLEPKSVHAISRYLNEFLAAEPRNQESSALISFSRRKEERYYCLQAPAIPNQLNADHLRLSSLSSARSRPLRHRIQSGHPNLNHIPHKLAPRPPLPPLLLVRIAQHLRKPYATAAGARPPSSAVAYRILLFSGGKYPGHSSQRAITSARQTRTACSGMGPLPSKMAGCRRVDMWA